jgi:hypothetical protein
MVKYSQSIKLTQPNLMNLDIPLLDCLLQVKDGSHLPYPCLVNLRDLFYHAGILANEGLGKYPL